MNYQQTTQVPNKLFDLQLSQLTHSELKILLYVIRKTNGYITKNGKRKKRDRIAHSQFIKATGISRRSLPTTIQSLILKHLISVTDYQGNLLHIPERRKGKTGIFYAPCMSTYAHQSIKVCRVKQKGVQLGQHNKTKGTKLKEPKRTGRQSDWERLEEILNNRSS